MVSFKN